jgi:hypothetical protein
MTGSRRVVHRGALALAPPPSCSCGFDPFVLIINANAAHVVGCPVSHIEILQVVRYQSGQRYDAHLDGIDFGQYPKDRSLLKEQTTHQKDAWFAMLGRVRPRFHANLVGSWVV